MTIENDHTASRLVEALSAVLHQVASPSTVLKTILHQAVSQTGAERGVFVEVNRSGKLTYRVLYRFQHEELTGDAGRYSSTILAQVLESGKGVRLGKAFADPRFDESGSIHEFNMVSVLCMPILVEDRVAALVHLECNRPDHFQPRHEELVGSLLEVSGPVLGALQASQGMIRQRDALKESETRARAELEENRDLLARDWSFGRFVGRSSAVRALSHSVARVAATDFPVLLFGETGTGKSILARVLHHQSKRAKRAFVTVFCPSFQREMVETELFGHKRGAFTGAVADRTGKVQAAENGTLFLDEIGDLPQEIQPKLLRLLQEKTYERVGDPRERKANVRVIAATNRDLRQEVAQGRFRRDLYERLNFVPIRIPPLRERKYDIPVLLHHFLGQHDEGRFIEITPESDRVLMELDFTWPGNVRHLEQLAARLAVQQPEDPVTPDVLRALLETTETDLGVGSGEPSTPGEAEFEAGLPAYLARAEKQWLEEAMRRYAGLSKKELARKLNIGESTLHKKIKLYEIEG